MTREALFHADPWTEQVRECIEPDCDGEHFGLMVRGAHSVERFTCEHEVNVVHWHELTPADHPAPACPEGCVRTGIVVG